jgi:hypothetical protein
MILSKWRKEGGMGKGGKNNDVASFPSTFCSSVVVNLNNVNQLLTSLDVSSTYITPATRTLWYTELPPAKPTKLIKLSTLVAFRVIIPMSFSKLTPDQINAEEG